MSRPPFPTVLNGSAMSDFRSCPKKFFWANIEHWKPITESIHLIAGGAYAKGLEVTRAAFYSGELGSEDAIAKGAIALLHAYGNAIAPPESAKSAENVLGAFVFYWERYPFEEEKATPVKLPGGGLGVEFSFSEPLEIKHPESGDPLLYVGRFDMICNYAGGIYGLDDKTTSQLGASWPKQWDLRSQFTGYTWGAQQVGLPLNGFLIRGLSILKTKYDTLQALTYRLPWQVEQWYEQLHRDVERAIESWDSGYWDVALDEACNAYGGCQFRLPCLAENSLPWLENSFERKEWNPVTRLYRKLENH